MILAIKFSFRKGGRHHVFIVSAKHNNDNQLFPTIKQGSWIFILRSVSLGAQHLLT